MSAPLVFQELTLRNFLSFGNVATTIELNECGSTFIQGENIDTASNNGAGKTTIINAICYALYNKPFDNISLQKLINSTNASKSTLMEVKLSFMKGNVKYEIYRCRGEVFNIQISMDGVDITLDSVGGNDKLIQEIIGISYELFTKIIVFSGSSTPFLLMPVSQQRGQIEELFNITLLTEKAVKLKEIIKTTEGSIAIQEAVIREQEGQVALYNKQLKDAEVRVTRWESDRETAATRLLAQLETAEELKTFDIEAEKELHKTYAEYAVEISNLSRKEALLKKDKTVLEKDVTALSAELEHLLEAKCPYCLQQYEGAEHKLTEKTALLADKKQKLEAVKVDFYNVVDELTQFQSAQQELKLDMKFESVAEALNATQAAASAQSKIDELIASENPHVEALEALKSQAIKTVSYADLDNIRKDLEHQQFLLKLLTDKNSFIRRRIISKTIPLLNNRLIHYTKQLGLPHIVKFDDDMSCSVSEYGRELDFGNLSGGEQKRVNLSLSLAFRDVLHELHAKVNTLFIDEIDASLDGAGVECVFKLLKQKTRDEILDLWIISHRPEAVGRFDRTVIIRKENGFSKILDESGSELGVT